MFEKQEHTKIRIIKSDPNRFLIEHIYLKIINVLDVKNKSNGKIMFT